MSKNATTKKNEVKQTADEELIDDVAHAVIEPPDGGWGWVVVFASFMCNLIFDGVIFTSGAFLPIWEETYDVKSGTVAWAASLLAGCYLMFGPVVSVLVNVFGCRKTAFAGTLIASTGFILSMFAPNIVFLLLTFGVLGGIGFGLIYLPSIVIVGYYFNKRRALATGIAVCGSGIGTFVMAPLMKFMIEEWNWRQVMFFVTAIVVHCFVFAALYRPLVPTRQQVDKFVDDGAMVFDEIAERKKRQGTSNDNIRNSQGLVVTNGLDVTLPLRDDLPKDAAKNRHRAQSEFVSTSAQGSPKTKAKANGRQRQISLFATAATGYGSQENVDSETLRKISRASLQALNRPLSRRDIFYPGSVKNLREFNSQPSVSHYIASTLNVNAVPDVSASEGNLPGAVAPSGSELTATLRAMIDLSLLKSPSVIMLCLGGFLTFTGFFVPFIYLPRQSESKGHSKELSTMLIQILGVTNIIGRIFCGWLSDRPKMNALMINNLALTAGGLATIVVPHLDAYWMLVVYCVIFGFGTACFAALRSIICVELLGLAKLTNFYGLCLLFMGLASLVGSPIAGFLKDATGSYAVSFYVTGTLVMLSGLIGFPLQAVNRWEKRRLGLVEEPSNGATPLATTHNTCDQADQVDSAKVHRISESRITEEDEEVDTRT